jgi:hypothetical protein
MTKNYLRNNDINTDELGRMIIEDLNLLHELNGAISDNPEFMVPDVACGNTNCVC